MPDVLRPAPAPPDKPKLFYRRGRKWPRAIAWYGFKSFWGHLWSMLASVVATEDIDSRDWMEPGDADELTERIARELRAASEAEGSLTDRLDRDVFVDFVADTGDDFSLSKAVARMVFADYEVDDPDEPGTALRLPRGDLLVFGGDTAYPVATDIEIHNRVIIPWNEVLGGLDDGTPRVLLGIPGNHDWYGGLDGFGRMFRRRLVKIEARAPGEDAVDRAGQIGHFIDWVEAFRVGKDVVKRAALVLRGYTPVQSASYWSLKLAPDLDLWGVDRQLRSVDFRQREFFARMRRPETALVLCVADPAYAFLEPNPDGQRTLRSLDLSIEGDRLLVLTGDTHHYCRQVFGGGQHVLAGGGGAFLHPTRIDRQKVGTPPAAEFPGPKTSFALALQIPWQIVHGRSGFIIHFAIALVYTPLFAVQWTTGHGGIRAAVVTAIVATIACMLLGGLRKNRGPITLLSLLVGGVIGFLPTQAHHVARRAVHLLGLAATPAELAGASCLFSVYLGTLFLGTYLMLLTILGFERHQGVSALAHPGYRHFVRLRVRRDGSRIDGWAFGKVDPLDPADPVVLVDRFSWKNAFCRAGD